MQKTYGLQQDGRDSDVRGGDEAVHSHGTHMPWVTQAVTHAITIPSPCSAACTYAACRSRAEYLDLRGEFSGISSTSHSVGLWAQDVRKTYGLQQDDGDSDECGRDEAVHSRGAQWRGPGSLKLSHLPYHHAVLHALALRAGSCNVWILAR